MTQVTYLIDNLLRAGTQTVLGYLVEGLAARGYHQVIFCLNRRFDPEIVAGLEANGARVVVLGKTQLLTGYGLAQLYTALRHSDILQTFLPASDIIGRGLGRLARVPLVVTSIRARNIDKRPWQLWLDRHTMSWAHRVVFNSERVVDFSMQNEGVRPSQVLVIPNGVRLKESSREGRKLLEGIVPLGVPVIGTVGRLRPQKGHAILIDAFASMRKETDAHLLIIGEGELRSVLEEQVRVLGMAERVHFLGTRADLPDLFSALTIYAHPAIFEGMPNAVMEAMAAGLPVVATEADGTLELIKDGETGWLVQVGDAGELAARLTDVLTDLEAARRVGAAGSAFIRENYAVERMVERFDAVYRKAPPPG